MKEEATNIRSPADIQQLVGSLILQYQQLELQLKFLLSRGSFRGTLRELELIFRGSPGAADNRTLGQLVKSFAESHLGPEHNPPDLVDNSREIHLSFHVTIGDTEEFRRQIQSRLSDLLTARNLLVHQSLLRFDFQTPEGRANAGAILEDQSRQLTAMRQDMDAMIQTVKAAATKGLQAAAKNRADA